MLELTTTYPKHHHHTINALIEGNATVSRACLSFSIRAYRKEGDREYARKFRDYASYLGWPSLLRENGRFI